ncbi:universal stress protein [Haloquadratum walsbyi]|uniref:UspA domain protein n=1 Tax=Haloquadratum walsbyi (strain DSM 16854 / JCM 12705 / C23) TaxID=768065 RepID=G0LGI5_HALWC|nr:universal stress protein [Haloquadratum walsbyi]CCC39205.1 UspA domain protein [Haloquadratum walsbyi C23]
MTESSANPSVEHILVPVDGSPQSESAVEYVTGIFPTADVTLLTVIDPVSGFAAYDGTTEGSWKTQAQQAAESLLAEKRSILQAETDESSNDDADIDTDTESISQTIETVVEFGEPVESIQEAADTYDVDQIVIGSHGRAGLQRIIVGSVAENVMRGVSIPVTIVR